MKLIDLIKKRRSVRRYLNKPIPRKALLECIEAARLAPSACNTQPWKFIIIDDKFKIKEITDKICHSAYSFNKFIGDSAALIIVVSDKEGFLRKAAGVLKGTDYYLIDIGIACEHLVLQAEELGIGSCWIGWFDERSLKKALKLPGKTKIDVVISLGYYDFQEISQKPRKTLEEVAVFNNDG
ncbi:MAG: NAD(P)H nitroreductase [Candidatus Omnitrophica bacterium]|nr:NAD(P)H nitroreductase [Candidatus Omnitrophota bacterium]